MISLSTFTERLRNLRNRKGLSQDELGKKIGKSREAVAKYEIGKTEPDLNSLSKLAKHFGVSVDYIIGTNDSDDIIIINNPEMKQYEVYLNDNSFIDYLRFAAKIKENGIDIEDIEIMVDNIIKYREKGINK